jgi:hypothetical protein
MSAGKPPRQKHLDNRDLAHRFKAQAFATVAGELGKRLTPVRANKIVEIMRRYGYPDDEIPEELLDLASRKRHGHVGGLVTSPVDGEERDYTVGENSRVGVPVALLGVKPGDKVRVKYGSPIITIRRG